MSRHPGVLWAQRSDKVYLTVPLPDAKDVSVTSEPNGRFCFSAKSALRDSLSFRLHLFDHILPEAEKGWWKRLLKSEEKPAPYIKVDWNRWCDEDDEESSESDVAPEDDLVVTGEDEAGSDGDGMLYLPDLEKARRI